MNGASSDTVKLKQPLTNITYADRLLMQIMSNAAISKYILTKRPIVQQRALAYLKALVINHAKEN